MRNGLGTLLPPEAVPHDLTLQPTNSPHPANQPTHSSKVIRVPIRLDQRQLPFLPRERLPVLHPDQPLVPLLVHELEDVAVVRLSRARLLPARRVARLHVADLVEALVEVVDHVPLADLRVVEVEQE